MDQNTAQVRISVIIPVYNCEKYLGEAVASVLNQPYKNIDIILVDDGSKDNSPALCDQFAAAHDRVRVIHQENAGVSAARNAGIEAVLAGVDGDCFENQYIAFLDADDTWFSNAIDDTIVNDLSNNYSLVGYQSCTCNHSLTRRSIPQPIPEGIHSGGSKATWINSKHHFGAAFYSLLLLHSRHIRFMNGLRNNEDWIFAIQCRYLANFILLRDKLLYCYRKNPASFSHQFEVSVKKYPPMIAAYLKSDTLMLTHRTPERGHLKEGRAMAAIYIVDMHEEHYQQFRPNRELEQVMREHPEYLELITSDFAFNRPDSGLRWQEMQAHPVKFRLRCYTKGFITVLAHKIYALLYRIPPIARIIDKKRYLVPMDKQQTKG